MRRFLVVFNIILILLLSSCSSTCKHKEKIVYIAEDATCEHNGTKKEVCKDCGEIISIEIIPMLDHTPGEWLVDLEPNCTEVGHKHQVCGTCGKTIKEENITANGHVDGEWIIDKQPGCTESGHKYQVCSVCGDTISEKDISPLGHKVGEWIIDCEANCTEKGHQHKVCSVCAETIIEEDINSLGHSAGELIVDLSPTCTEKGHRHQVCSVCGVTIKEEVISPLGHTAGKWIIDKDPTCTLNGHKHQVCSVCGATIKEEDINKLGHNLEQSYDTHKCLQGKTILNCSRCDYKEEYDWTPITFTPVYRYFYSNGTSNYYLLDLKDFKGGVVDFNNGTKKLNEYTIKVKNVSLNQDEGTYKVKENGPTTMVTEYSWLSMVMSYEIEITDGVLIYRYTTNFESPNLVLVYTNASHNEGEWIIDKNSSCTEKGHKHKICLTCNEIIEEQDIELSSHLYDIDITPCNCTNHGIIHYQCKNCSYNYEDFVDRITVQIPLSSYSTTNGYVTKISITTRPSGGYGKYQYKYEVYYLNTSNLQPNLGYDYGNNNMYTLTGSNLNSYIIKIFIKDEIGNEAYVYYYIKDLGFTNPVHINREHIVKDWVVDKEPSCTEQGHKYGLCSMCGEKIELAIDAYGHTPGEWIVDSEPNCTQNGHKHQICSVCKQTIKEEYISSLGHTPGEWTIDSEPTCSKAGLKHTACTVCHSTIYESIGCIPHSFVEQNTDSKFLKSEATCEQGTIYYYSCKCGKASSSTFEVGEPLGHLFENYESNHDATCQHDGTSTAICSRKNCNAISTIPDVGSILPHTYDQMIIDNMYYAGKNDNGTVSYYYSCICGATRTETFNCCIDGNHEFGDYHSNNDGTCVKRETLTAECLNPYCDICDTIEGEYIDNHHYILDFAAITNGDVKGYVYKCSDCQKWELYDDDFNSYSYLYDYSSLFCFDSFDQFELRPNLVKFYYDILLNALEFHTDYSINLNSSDVYTVYYDSYGFDVNTALAVWSAVRRDWPIFYWYDSGCSYGLYSKFITIKTEPAYYNGNDRKKFNELVTSSIEEIINNAKLCSTDYDKAKYIHDYIILNCEYAYEDDGVTAESDLYAHSILGFFTEGKFVCEGYAKLSQLLLNMLDIDTICIYGLSNKNDDDSNHAWNYVLLDEKWYFYDATWDDTKNSNISYKYFLKGSQTVSSLNRSYWTSILSNNTSYQMPIPTLSIYDY